MKVLLIGGGGQLGNAIKDVFDNSSRLNSMELVVVNKNQLNFLNYNECKSFIKAISPFWVINAAAYTAVDEAERNLKKAMSINKDGPRAIAETLLENGGNLLQISTDFVFDGNNINPYLPEDITNPINVYGKSKDEGDKVILSLLESSNQVNIIRTSWLMGPVGKNFLKTMIRLHNRNDILRVVYDQIGCPTSTYSLANTCWELIVKSQGENSIPNILHWSDAGVASWYDISVAIGELGKKYGLISEPAFVDPITTDMFPTYAKRPKYSLLNCEDTSKILNLKRIHWRYLLEKNIIKIKEIN